jgi:hypothetical protein
MPLSWRCGVSALEHAAACCLIFVLQVNISMALRMRRARF